MRRQQLVDFMSDLYDKWGNSGQKAKEAVVAARLGVSVATVNSLKNGEPSARGTVIEMARSAGLSISEFLWVNGYVPEKEQLEADRERYGTSLEDSDLLQSLAAFGQIFDSNTMPVLGSTEFGLPEHPGQEEPVEFMESIGAKYLLRVNGQSMEPLIHDGEIVTVRPCRDPKVGQIVIAVVGSANVCKRLRSVEHKNGEAVYTLEPANSKYGAIRESEVTFQGIVLGKYTSF